jgi:hypothetical protein
MKELNSRRIFRGNPDSSKKLGVFKEIQFRKDIAGKFYMVYRDATPDSSGFLPFHVFVVIRS